MVGENREKTYTEGPASAAKRSRESHKSRQRVDNTRNRLRPWAGVDFDFAVLAAVCTPALLAHDILLSGPAQSLK